MHISLDLIAGIIQIGSFVYNIVSTIVSNSNPIISIIGTAINALLETLKLIDSTNKNALKIGPLIFA